MNFLTPLAFLGGLLAIPIILMYMLRLRRREVSISSTFLWAQVLQDTEANTPWQKLRRNLLLLLQLLILLLLVLTLARPFITVDAVSAGQVTVLLDASASMNATDVDGGTRFDAARDEAFDIVDTLGEGNAMTVIRVAGVPEVLASSTTDKDRLRGALNGAEPGNSTADWEAALSLAAASSTTAEDFSIVLISDGGLPDDVGLQGVGGEVRYVPVGQSGENVAITALATRSRPGQTPELYAQITNYGQQEARVTFALRVDGERLDAENLDIPPGGEQPFVASSLPPGFKTIEASLTPRVNALVLDGLPADNRAFAVVEDGDTRRVLLVTDGNVFLEQAMRSLPGINAVRTDGQTGIPDGFDLYVFDEIVPQTLPDGDLMFVNPARDTPYFTLNDTTEETSNPRVVDESDSRVNFVQPSQIRVARINQVADVGWAEPLLAVDGGPMLLAGETDGRQIALMPFNLSESNLPLDIAWPVLIANLSEWFTPRAAIEAAGGLSVGDTLAINPPFEADTVRVTPPDGEPEDLPVEGDQVVYTGTDTTGLYTLELLQGDAVIGTQSFAVNLFSPLESDIAPVAADALTIPGAAVNATPEAERGQQELWPWVALAALVVLMIEWYAYYRRLHMPTLFRPVPAVR